jgi:C-terminal processing protease CtpA/Prc
LASYITAASGTKGLVVDIRNYPAEFVALALAGMLVTQETPFATFMQADLVNPGVFSWGASSAVKPASPHYAGKVIVLVDEVTQSQAEYTAMALRAVPGALVVGSTTAGADGNLSMIALPAGLRAAISGIGVFYPDRRATQRVGILPDIRISPSAKGLRAGRDEVLEAGIRAILGASASPQSVEKMARH